MIHKLSILILLFCYSSLNSQINVEFIREYDNLSTVRLKLKNAASLDKLGFKEEKKFDNFYNSETSVLSLVNKNDYNLVQVYVNNDRIRLISSSLELKKYRTIEELNKIKSKFRKLLKHLINKSYFQKSNHDNFYIQKDKSGEYFSTIVYYHDYQEKLISYYFFYTPQTQLNYLKYSLSDKVMEKNKLRFLKLE